MSEITIGLIVVALILISLNITMELIQRDFMGLGSLCDVKSGFTPMSSDYEGDSPVFQPDGYGEMGSYVGMTTAPMFNREIKNVN